MRHRLPLIIGGGPSEAAVFPACRAAILSRNLLTRGRVGWGLPDFKLSTTSTKIAHTRKIPVACPRCTPTDRLPPPNPFLAAAPQQALLFPGQGAKHYP